MKSPLRSLLLLLLFLFAATQLSPAQAPSNADLVRSRELFDAGNQLLAKGAPQQAISKYNEAIALAPSEPLSYINRGVAYVLLSKFAEATQDADKALSIIETGLYPVKPKAIAYEIKGMVAQAEGNNQLAIDHFSKALALDSANPKALTNRGNSYRALKQFDLAIKDFDAAIALDSTLPHAFINRGSVHATLKNLTAALRDLDEAARLDPSQELTYYNRAGVYVTLAKYDLALEDYNKAIALKPRAEFLNARGKLFYTLGKYDRTIQDNTEALALNGRNVSAFADRALANGRLGKDALAIEDIRKALGLKGESSLLRYNLAYFLYKSGQFAASAEEATRVIASAPQWQAPYRLRANAYIKLGNPLKAKNDLAIAGKLSSKNKPEEGDMVFVIDLLDLEDISQ